jgi:hypothetical protein
MGEAGHFSWGVGTNEMETDKKYNMQNEERK